MPPSGPPAPRGGRLGAGIAIVGLLVMAGGFVLQATTRAESWLSESEAQSHVDAAVSLHGETVRAGQPGSGEEPATLAAARNRLAETTLRVEAAQWRSRWLPRVVQGAGALVAGIGLAVRRAGV